VGRLLSKDYPKEFMPYVMLSAVAQMTPDTEKSLKILKELVALDDSDPKIARIVDEAKGQLKKMEALGKPLDMKFTALDGREVDLSQMKGKVVLIDFWATWCGPCVREIPSVKKTYDELRKQGFEIIGISMDSDKKKLESFLAKNEMPWPQFFDGKGWKTSLAQEHGISSIPAMWLVDKKGNLVDQNARSGLEEKVKKYLAQ
jgi:thiol-disulfide isomerase/thioredoxin